MFGDFLQPQMLLDRHRIVGATFDGGIVGDKSDFFTLYFADTGEDAGRRRFAVVHAVSRQWRELEERRARVQQALDAFARQELAARAVAPHCLLAAALPDLSQTRAQL